MRNIRLIARRELRASSNQNRRVVIARAGMVLRVASLHWRRERGRHAMGPVFLLTGFRADRPLSVVLLMVAVAPIVTLTLIPLIAARLFVEEKQTRTIETLFTSPISDYENHSGQMVGRRKHVCPDTGALTSRTRSDPAFPERGLVDSNAVLLSAGVARLRGSGGGRVPVHVDQTLKGVAATGTMVLCLSVLAVLPQWGTWAAGLPSVRRIDGGGMAPHRARHSRTARPTGLRSRRLSRSCGRLF